MESNKFKFTKSNIKKLQPGNKRSYYYDTAEPNLMLQVTPIAKFNDTVFNAGVSFVEIHTKPARGGYFYYRGDGIDYSKYPKYYENVLDFSGAKFETEVSFFGRRFFEDTSFSRATFYNKFWFSECNIGLKTNFNANFACDGIKNIDMCYRILKDVLSKEGYFSR